ncbi:asparagine synthetase B family protein [Arhodomonas sp. SL1]|uniref:asparagine synthetase B family protein n=1 Tax=Arhodomonas sp. SL1 TaxID=3425691 RepID=UPI003F88576A
MAASGFLAGGGRERPGGEQVTTAPGGWLASPLTGGEAHPGWLGVIEGGPRWPRGCAPESFDALVDGLAAIDGEFALIAVARDARRGLVAIDRLGREPVYYAHVAEGVLVSTSLAWLAAQPGVDAGLDQQALYHYLYGHAIPAPLTVYRGVRRLRPGEALILDRGDERLWHYWWPVFHESLRHDRDEAAARFRSLLADGVARCLDGAAVGAFLSGGTDSSTVVGMLARVGGAPVQTFSIGFNAAGYDESHYARIAARHFGTKHHEYFVTPEDVAAAVPILAAGFDQPFGNASVVPAYYCARRAAEEGVTRLLGGDGGDELFGGNARYAKQWLFSLYGRLPAAARDGLIEPVAARLPTVGPARKLRRYVDQAKLPLAERTEGHNLLRRLGPAAVLVPEFVAAVDTAGPLRLIDEAMGAEGVGSDVNRLLARDMRFTLADDDLPKVRGACALAGLEARFPLLDDDLLRFALGLPPQWKVRGTRLRPFFKVALRDLLPTEIIAKRKHGFGLPFGVWLAGSPALHELAADSLSTLAARGIVRPAFISELLDRHLPAHPAYYGTLVWVLMILEQWFETRATGQLDLAASGP